MKKPRVTSGTICIPSVCFVDYGVIVGVGVGVPSVSRP